MTTSVRFCDNFIVQVIKIFNLFITYGDTFLPNPATYDELYYELIRVHKVFEDLYSIGIILNGMMFMSLVYVMCSVSHSIPETGWATWFDFGLIRQISKKKQ